MLSRRSSRRLGERTIALGNPIKSLGAHDVTVRLHDEVTAQVSPT